MDNNSPLISDPIFTLSEAAQYIRCSKVFIWQRRRAGDLVGLHAGRKVLFRKSELDRFLVKESRPLNETL